MTSSWTCWSCFWICKQMTNLFIFRKYLFGQHRHVLYWKFVIHRTKSLVNNVSQRFIVISINIISCRFCELFTAIWDYYRCMVVSAAMNIDIERWANWRPSASNEIEKNQPVMWNPHASLNCWSYGCSRNINLLWPDDVIWRYTSGLRLTRGMDCIISGFCGIHMTVTSLEVLIISICKMEWEITAASPRGQWVNTLRPRQNGRYFADDIFKCIFLNENVWIPIKIWLRFVPKGPINNIPALVQIMAWRRPGDKPLSEPMMVCLTTHICVTRPQWVNSGFVSSNSGTVCGRFGCTNSNNIWSGKHLE